jgi:hypothetical protein
VLSIIQDTQFVGDQLDFAGGNVLVDGVRVAQLDRANDGDHEFIAQQLCLFVNGRFGLFAENDLRDAGAVAYIHKNEIAEVAAAVYPSHQDRFLAGIGGAQRAAHVSTSQVA